MKIREFISVQLCDIFKKKKSLFYENEIILHCQYLKDLEKERIKELRKITEEELLKMIKIKMPEININEIQFKWEKK